jgi:uncharacterized protein (DUF2062 family)
MGIFPIWGFQLAVAIPLAFLFRLNKALVIIAANISIPPLIPLILYLSYTTGKVWMGRAAQSISFNDNITFELIHKNFLQYVYGAITLAIVAGVFFGVLTYGILKLRKMGPASTEQIEK